MGDGSDQPATGLLALPPGQPLDKQTVRLPAVHAGPGARQHLIAPDHFRALSCAGIRFPAMVPAP